MPELMEVLVMKEGMDLPPPELPYYVLAKEGLYLLKETQIGVVMVPEKTMPYTVGSIGEDKQGVFYWEGENIPGFIIGQATDFFRRIYEKHKTEAEVLIVKHNETNEYRLFVPFQRTSGAGVKSLFEPTHVHRDYSIVGTIHSHCMMPAFHSGTDTADASEMDGVHFTIGQVMNHPPQIVAMVSMNKKNFHYAKPSDIADLEFEEHKAPEWWDSYVFPAGTPAEKPKSLRSITQAIWDEFKGIRPVPVNNNFRPHWDSQGGGWRGDYQPYQPKPFDYNNRLPVPVITQVGGHQISNESAKFNAKQERRNRKRDRQQQRGRFNREGVTNITDWMTISLALDEATWSGVFTDDDWYEMDATDLEELPHWQQFFSKRMAALADVLDTLGMTVEFNIRSKAPKAQLPGQTKMTDYIGGAL